MTAPLNSNMNTNTANYRFVVKPADIKPYSFYKELKLDEDHYLDFLSTTRTVSPDLKKSKRKSFFKGLFKTAVAVGLGVLAYKHRSGLKDFCVNIYNRIKNLIK